RPWDTLGPVRLGGAGGWPITFVDEFVDDPVTVRVVGDRAGLRVTGPDGGVLSDLEMTAATLHRHDGHTDVWVTADGTTRRLRVVPATRHADPAELAGGAAFASPMPGSVVAVAVETGQTVAAGATLVVVEAMKMEHPVTAPADGTITAVHVTVGQAVEAGAPLLAFEPATD
ncbi:MAG: biotin/lipoyl-containing protein, partial [Egicoccus sp.]